MNAGGERYLALYKTGCYDEMCRNSLKHLHIFVGCIAFCMELLFSKYASKTLGDAKEMQVSLTSVFGLSLDGNMKNIQH